MFTLPFSLVLASRSPRRAALLRQIGVDFTVAPADLDEENLSLPLDAYEEYVVRLAMHKAHHVGAQWEQPAVVLAADTIVVLEGEIFNKPADPAHAYQMLRRLSGRTHTVYTGYVLHPVQLPLPEVHRCRATRVTFRALEDEEIWAYIRTGSPMDKAGAYGIQDDFGAVFVDRIEGCYYTVVGLPLSAVYQDLRMLIRKFAAQQSSAENVLKNTQIAAESR